MYNYMPPQTINVNTVGFPMELFYVQSGCSRVRASSYSEGGRSCPCLKASVAAYGHRLATDCPSCTQKWLTPLSILMQTYLGGMTVKYWVLITDLGSLSPSVPLHRQLGVKRVQQLET